jgi:hypothetical protein
MPCYDHGNSRNPCRSTAAVRPGRGRIIEQRAFEICPCEPDLDRVDQSSGAEIRFRDNGIFLIVCEKPFAEASAIASARNWQMIVGG